MEKFIPLQATESAPVIFSLFPENLDPVELWAVWRKVIQVQPLSSPLAALVVDGLTLVNGSIIDHHNA